ncbi:uncharacterized protein BHQ10_002113 [Talaromyces amestolkiae]|uniref:Uncharacterized protein n=1 Tax=Talaromyces amestolkiae TaxID=1196081 RepID=A0A364KRG5_TALAM|nr:uncharacterized protein BHQ10_002113 [Talaromyces amestolkiae]RAO66101.1 hypothetical protein BHQ10_002113 [Talaromyces amestolkiae]
MRLRKTIRVPSRYDDECELSTGVSPRRLPRRRKAAVEAGAGAEEEEEEERAIPYVDYDPNQPPAAFPTLEHPLPAGQTYHSLPTATPPPAAAANASPDTDDADLDADRNHHLDAFNSLYRGIPPEKLDNFIASNGPQNPQYKRNMALLAREDDDFNLEISDDDDGRGLPGSENAGAQWIHREEPIPNDPQWADISLSLQIEIAENMLETHRLSTIQLLLGLSQSDTEQLTRNLRMHNADLEYENRVLAEMRNKQMQVLMCLDNSDLKQHSVPGRLVMSKKVWNHCHRVIQKRSQMRYLLCQAGDLLLARKYLSKRGLPMRYAGEWDNQFVATPSISSTGGFVGILKWKSSTESQSGASTTAAGDSRLLPKTRIGAQDPSPITVSETLIVQLPAAQRYEPMPRVSTPQASTNRDVQLVLHNQALVRLRIGRENAARIHIEYPATPSRRHMDALERFLPTPRTRTRAQTREPNSDDTIEELPSESDRIEGTSRLQPPELSFSTRPRPGSFNNIFPAGPPIAKPKARQFDQATRISTDQSSTLDDAHSFDSSPPQPSDLSALEGVVHGNSQNLTARNAMPTPAASSPNYSTTTKLTAHHNHNHFPKTSVETCLATPESYRTDVGERQLKSYISAYNRSSMPSNGNLGSATASFSRSDTMVNHVELKKDGVAQADAGVFSPSKAMQGLNLLPSLSMDFGVFVGHQEGPGTNHNSLAEEAPPGHANRITTPQAAKSAKYINPLFGLDSFDIHADHEEASQNVKTSESSHSRASTGQGQTVAGIEEPPSINTENANGNQRAVEDIPNNHLSAISTNVTVDVMPLPRERRQSVRKQTAGTKRGASTEMKAAHPKRGKFPDPASTPTTRSATNATSSHTTNPPVPRGRGRPRKYPIQQ